MDLPKSVSRIPEPEVKKVVERFEELVDLRPAPGPPGHDDVRASNYRLFWPSERLISRAIPGGIGSLDRDDGYDYYEKLDLFFSRTNVREVYFWAIGAEGHGVYQGHWSPELASWIKVEMVLSPVAVLSVVRNVVMIADDQRRFSVVGGEADIIAALESSFGGAGALKHCFKQWIEQYGIGFGEADKAWAYRYPYALSGWS